MSWKIFIVLLIILALYIYSYYRYPKVTLIMQSHIRMFKPELLLDKQPIVIDDNDIILTTFKSKFFAINPSSQFVLNNSEIWYKNRYKYIILQSTNGPADILLCNPNYVDSKTNQPIVNANTDTDTETDTHTHTNANANANADDAEIVEVQLSEGQIVIIPFNWLYFIQNSYVECIGIHDYITYFLP